MADLGPDLRMFEDLEPGEVVRSAPIRLTREAIIAFARLYDPQPFHLDEASASRSLLGGLAASGWHMTALGMRLYYDSFIRSVASMGAPAVDEVRWLRPLRAGTDVSLVITVGEKRESSSRPDLGIVAMVLELKDTTGETIMVQKGPLLVQRRGTSQRRPAAAPAIAPTVPQAPGPAHPMLAAPFEEIEVGTSITLGTERFTPEVIKSFARLYDPQYFHVDEAAAEASHFGGLIASGWQTAAFWMKHYIAARERSAEARRQRRLIVETGGPSPGFTGLKWPRPVRAGDVVTYGLTVSGKRRVRRPGWGVIETLNTGHTADGTLVFSFQGQIYWPAKAEVRAEG